MQVELKVFLDNQMESLGFSHYGLCEVTTPLSFAFYRDWVSEGLHGDMKYLADHAAVKEYPQSKWPQVQSALIFAMPYYPHPVPAKTFPLKQARLSLYSKGMDYHHWFRARMQGIADSLKIQFPAEEFLCMTDSSPVLERDLAYRASLGWVGKNTCLIHPKKGSLFFIGEIYTSLKLKNDLAPLPDFCGTCTRCMDICPTGAIVAPRKLDARKCISYLTIEARTVPPVELRTKIGDWLFGCDLCQTTCPWNQKVFKNQLSQELVETLNLTQQEALIEDLRYILSSSGKKLERDLHGTALDRAGPFGLKKNALIVTANRKIHVLHHEVKALLAHEKLGELAQWTLQELAKVP